MLTIIYDVVKQMPLKIMSVDRPEKTLLLEVALENILPHFVSCYIQMERFFAYSLDPNLEILWCRVELLLLLFLINVCPNHRRNFSAFLFSHHIRQQYLRFGT